MEALHARLRCDVKSPVLCLRCATSPASSRGSWVLLACGINVLYSYSLISTYIALSVKDRIAREELLADEPVELLAQKEIAASVPSRREVA